ncbi:unnamed protein product [Allacma fusca]|uniref:RUN domain-containing protein n=1 Tax=Allacma fusca TaxID=39272 RepID=A0A8J2JLZ4_9HEXA|nr:unnamed protein product [Allacma fusca]
MELEYLENLHDSREKSFQGNGDGAALEPEGENESEEWDAWEGLKARPERYAPLGANDSDKEHSTCGPLDDNCTDLFELHQMKEDQEQLTSALLALTTHFAQVQFRVQQIVEAPQTEKETLLKDLQDFAFRGIPSAVTERLTTIDSPSPVDDIQEKMRLQAEKQRDLIGQLKSQLEELESYAYETGEAGLPQSVLLQRHKLVVEQLRDRLHLNVDELEKLSDDDLKLQVDQAISELVSPLKMKEELVNQLKTQITDLERFIHFLHGEGTWDGDCTCACPKHGPATPKKFTHTGGNVQGGNEEEIRAKTIQLMKKALTLIQMFAVAQFGCSTNHFHMNTLKKNAKGNHWGDLRAQLEVAIGKVHTLAVQAEAPVDSDYTSDSEDAPVVSCNQALTSAVRKDLAMALADLFQHGLMLMGQSQSLVPFLSCFPARSSAGSGFMTVWDLILRYYHLKNGEKYNATPARRLSQSFGLEIVGSKAITNRELLLSTIDNIICSHSRYKRSQQSHFKAFVCAALNSKKLVHWLRLIVRCQGLIEQCYQPWSYVAKTGCEDSFRSLEKLTSINFNLPVDLAIRQIPDKHLDSSPGGYQVATVLIVSEY